MWLANLLDKAAVKALLFAMIAMWILDLIVQFEAAFGGKK